MFSSHFTSMIFTISFCFVLQLHSGIITFSLLFWRLDHGGGKKVEKNETKKYRFSYNLKHYFVDYNNEPIEVYYIGKILKNSKTQLGNKMELDIYLPELKLAIEYNGDYWHNLKEAKHPGCHEDKRNRCKERGIKLIEVLDTEWQKNKDQIKESLKKQIEELIKISTKIKSG